MKHCGKPGHVNPYWDCVHCSAKRGVYQFHLRGPGWTPKFGIWHGDLPPHDEVIARKREQGIKTLRSSEEDS